MARFKFTNYVPRNELEYYANHELARIAEHMPYHSSIKAESTQTDDGFIFSVQFTSLNESFAATATIKPAEKSRHNRMWQKPAIDKIILDLKKQIRTWHDKRRIEATKTGIDAA